MASQPQPLPPALPCTSPTAAGGAGLAASSPEKGTARPKPPVRPKPRVLPKPAVPAKPSLPQPPPGPRHPRPELPSAEKLNRLAGPQPYSAGGAGGPVRRPSFTIKSPETSNGKGLPSPSAAAAEDSGSIPGEEVPPALLTPPRKSPSPFKVTPVPVATKPERFPGTTVEEILAKMDSREGPGSPDRARLSPFCPDPSPRFGSKTFSAFRRRPSGAADGAPPAEPHQTPQPVAGELGKEHDGHRVAETSSSPPAGPSCAGDPRGCQRPPSPADLSFLQPSALGAPGSPRHPTSPAPGAPFQPTQPPISTPGSPDAPAELPAPGSPTPAPSSPESPAQPPAEVPATPSQAPGAPCSTAEPRPGASRSPGSPHTPGEGSPDTGSPPTTPELPPRVTCPPGSPESAAERWGPPSPAHEPPVKVSCPPGSPEGPDDSSASPQSPKGPDSSPPPPSRDSGLRRCSEGLLQPLPVGQGLGELGGSLSTLPHPGDPPPELSLGGWNLSQSFEWTFPGQGAQRLVSPPCSPIRETPDLGLSIECELDGGDPAPRPSCSRGNSGSEEPCPTMASSWAAEGAPCPGGPVAQREAEGSAEEEEGEAEQDATVPCSPLCVTEPGQDPAEPEPPAQPNCPIMAAPMDPAPTDPPPTAELAWAPVGDRPGSLQGPGGPGRAEGPSKGADPHADPGWLTELLASPRAHRTGLGSPNAEGLEDQLSWSPKGLCGDFGAGSPHHGTFSWSCEAVARERDWPGETERDRDPETKPDWGSAHSAGDGDRQDRPFGSTCRDWGSAYQGTELTGETSLGCSDWPESRGTGESCRQDQDFGAGKPQWGSGEESGSGRADWSSGCGLGHGLGHGQQRDREPGSRQHSWAGMYGSGHPERRDGDITSAWAGEYSAGNVEMKDRDLSLGWTREYSSRDPETKDEDLTLGWAGRSSTGDTGTPEKEFSPSRVAWDSEYSAQDMESQDREFSPSRPAWTGDTSTRDMESQDREFSPSRPVWTGDTSTRDMESQDQEFSPSRPAWTGDTSTRDMESQDREFSPSRPAWTGDTSTRDMESQDQEFSPSRPAWTGDTSTRDMESQDREFSPSRPAWTGDTSTRDMESQDREFSPSRPAWTGDTSTRDMESQDREFSPSRPAWTGDTSTRDMESQDREFSPSRPAWTGDTSTRDMESQDREFSPSRPAWTGDTSTRDMESQDREFSPSRPAWTGDTSTRDMESQDREFSPSRPVWTGDTSTRDMESQDREFSPSQPPWDDEYRTRDVEMQDEEFSSSRVAWASEGGSREVESRDSGCKPGRPTWDSGYSTGDVGSQGREFSPSQAARVSEHGSANTAKEGEFSHERLSWAGERSLGQTELVSAFGVGKDDASGCHGPEAPEPGWGSTGWQECDVTGSRDWAGELGGAERHNQFGVIGTERVPEPYSARAPSDGSVSWTGGLGEPLGAWHRALDFGSSGAGGAGAVGLGQPTWGTGLGSLAVPNTPTAPNTLPAPSALPTPGSAGLEEPGWSGGCDTEATRQEWASAFGARCAARSRDFSAAEQSLGGDASSTDGTLHLSAPSPPVGDTLAVPHIEECPRSEPPSPTEEEQDVPAPADPPHSPSLRAAGGSLPDSESEGSPAEHPDGGSPPSGQGEQPCPAGPLDCAGQDFSFLEDTAVLDSSVYRSKASLGRKRPHRAPALRPAAAAEGDGWIFRDSTEPRAARPDASSDEEAVEEPRSRRVRASPLGRGVKVPLFPSLSASALKAKLRGRNRSAEEGAVPGDGKATPPRDPHVQRSKSCKIPGLSGKPLALPPKPDKSSGSDASPPHWLQALKLKKKKP
ncbi:182 kDa tankyrase-1-binding protein isoform X2 [Patagioenas fasciata]|uniref:182 kDa tankyrase-1-binding protein isoform X2 n=1 Tax=Patagioenas fasciata TaxID=372321 RepID=UPI0032E8AFC7